MAKRPDDFLMNPLELRPFEALEVIERVRARLRQRARSAAYPINATALI